MGPLGSTQQVQGSSDGGANWNVRQIDASGAVAVGDGLISVPPGPGPYLMELPLIDAANLGGRVLAQRIQGLPALELVAAVGVGQVGVVLVGLAGGPSFTVPEGAAVVLVASEVTFAGGYVWVAESVLPAVADSSDVANVSNVAGGTVTNALDTLLTTPQPGRLGNVVTRFGVGTYVVPAGVSSLVVELTGGGGGGAGYAGGGIAGGAGAGGGGGGFVRARYAGVLVGEGFDYVVGSFGAGGVGLVGGGVGVTSRFAVGRPDQIEAWGGAGGAVMLQAVTPQIVYGAQGGFALPSGPYFQLTGGTQGGNAVRISTSAFAAGHGGATARGAGGFGQFGNGLPPDNGYGGGGSGGSATAGNTGDGGRGGGGGLTIFEYS
jgi:hypothetical protein